MTIKRLEQYTARKREIAYLRRRVAELEEQAKGCVCDTVKASFKSFPYTEHVVTVRGYSKRRARHLSKAICTLAEREADQAKELAAIEKWISTVEDSKTRLLIQMYYLEDKTWQQAAEKAYGGLYGDAARMRVKRYCEKKL